MIGVVCAAVLNIGLDLLLIPSMGPSGGGVATIAAEAFVLLYMLRRVTVLFGAPHIEWLRIARGALAAAIMGVVLVPLKDAIPVWPCVVLGAAVYLAAALALGVVRIDELRSARRGGGAGGGRPSSSPLGA